MAWLRWIVSHASCWRCAVLAFLAGMPADGGGIEEDLRAAQRGEARRLGIPLVPADADADPAVPRLPGAEAEIAGREVELLVVQRVVRDVHLPVLAEVRAVGVDDRRGVVVERPRARFSNSDAMITTPSSFATALSASVLGPGIGSASSKYS